MAETIQINSLEQGRGACDVLKSAAQKVDAARQSASTSFQALSQINPDLGATFISELNNSLNDIYEFLNNKLFPAAEAYFQSDDDVTPDDPGGNDNNRGGGRSGGNSGGSGAESAVDDSGESNVTQVTPGENEVPVVPVDPTPTEDNSVVAAVNIEEIDTSSLTEMQLNDLNSLVDNVVDLAKQDNKKLDELLESDVNSDKIKQMLLESPYVPQEFKAIITDLDSSIVRLLLDYILKGNSPEVFDLNTLNLGIVYSLLGDVAKQNGISVQDLMTKPEYSQLLRDTLSEYDAVVDLIEGWEELSPEDFQEQLRTFYFGDEVSSEFPDQDITVTREYVDYLAEACDVYYEDFLNDKSYAETLKEGAKEFGKSLTFFKASSFFTDQGMRNNVIKMFDGTNYKAFGMTKDNVESFRKEIDSLAKTNNTTSSNVLTNSQYADQVKDALMKSDSAKGVGFIYKNSESSVSQSVAKNIYSTTFEKSTQQKELDELAAKGLTAAAKK